jgi:hypothetical protein
MQGRGQKHSWKPIVPVAALLPLSNVIRTTRGHPCRKRGISWSTAGAKWLAGCAQPTSYGQASAWRRTMHYWTWMKQPAANHAALKSY